MTEPPPLRGTIGALIIEALSRHDDRPAFVHGERILSYRDVRSAISRAIQELHARGLKRGDTVVQLTHNRPEQWLIAAALFIGGFRSVALHALGGADDHAHIINDSEAVCVLFDAAFAERMPGFRDRCPQVQHWLCHDEGTAFPAFWRAAVVHAQQPLTDAASPEDVVRLGYTGGTTGRPKGVMLSSRSLHATAAMSIREWEMPEEMRTLCAAPISHGAASLIIPTLWRGGTVHIAERFNAGSFIDTVERHRITALYGVPTMLYALMDHPRAAAADWSSVGLIIYGGAPMATERIAQALAMFGPVLNQAYGQTEAPSCITFLRKADHAAGGARLLSCGTPYRGIDVAVRTDDGAEAQTNAVGEICVRGPHVMSGYWKQPEETAQVMRDGWLHTGDLAYRDEDGFFYLVDRKRDMIISGGFNVYPREVEDALMAHPDVSMAAVIGASDTKWGEAVTAFVTLRAGAQVDAIALREHVRALKGAVQAPKRIAFSPSLPLTALGKPDKKKLRTPEWIDQARAV